MNPLFQHVFLQLYILIISIRILQNAGALFLRSLFMFSFNCSWTEEEEDNDFYDFTPDDYYRIMSIKKEGNYHLQVKE